MMRRYDLIVFDLDGTLLNTAEGVLGCASEAIAEMGYEVPPFEQMRSFIGPPLHITFKNVFGLTDEQTEDMVLRFRKRYATRGVFMARIYDGIPELLKKLKSEGYLLAVATNKREDYAVQMLEHFGLAQYFDVIHGPDDGGVLKKNDLILMCMRELGVTDKDRAVMIGDSRSDTEGAALAGIGCIGVTYGFGFEDRAAAEKAGAQTSVDSPEEIHAVIAK